MNLNGYNVYRVTVIETAEVIDLHGNAPAAAGWLVYAKRLAGGVVGEAAHHNWTAQLQLMEGGDVMAYALPDAAGGARDFARVEVLGPLAYARDQFAKAAAGRVRLRQVGGQHAEEWVVLVDNKPVSGPTNQIDARQIEREAVAELVAEEER